MAGPLTAARTIKKDSIISANSSQAKETPPFDRDQLRKQARWIRDTLDPQVAQDGPDALHSDDILTLDELLRGLIGSGLGAEDIRYSRIHLAVNAISGKATRWPSKLIDRCESLRTSWEQSYGHLGELGTPLYEPGGRLHGICKPEDVSKEKLLVKWMRTAGVKISPIVARKPGALGFTPGSWWINPFFAYRDGIIDNGNSDGGVVSDGDGAYAVVLTGGDEVSGPDPNSFQYRCRDKDPGRYRLTAGTPESRHPIRVLRSHTLRSFWKPRAGLRYDGLCVRARSDKAQQKHILLVASNHAESSRRHRVTGWTIKHDNRTNQMVYIVNFRRLVSESSMELVLKRPWSDEIEDYTEYKRIRDLQRERSRATSKPTLTRATDGINEWKSTPIPASYGPETSQGTIAMLDGEAAGDSSQES
ncbi:hypothetical protein AC579_9969 [Pseudocercospora musae]|uniref:YDG domain-containing protein n=1 Tax=Pseudocercospora musae TaxID=113226 RepID=A0A139ILW7_9PEZI|nr:hypothetical protein AC579_9969 [Pseudocercospora musae]